LYEILLTEIDIRLREIEDKFSTEYRKLKDAWRAARGWATTGESPSEETSIVVPYVGSGLNRLAEGGVGSWADLVKNVADLMPEKLGTEHQIHRSGLTMPQQLEIYLRQAATDRDLPGNIFEAFEKAFGGQGSPSSFHKRLVSMFPVLLTTSYNDLLAASDPSNRKVFDVTDPSCGLDLTVPSICHLHGRWASDTSRKELQNRIFAGVGSDKHSRPCLVLTENQYHRLYSDQQFRDALECILGSRHVLLFLGASLANDEAGIHNILTARRLSQGSFSGLYVGFDLDPLKKKLLALRGIQCINLPREFGLSRHATEMLFHALFDCLEKRFGVNCPSVKSPAPVLPGPEILCVGLSSWNRIFSLRSRPRIGTETSYKLGGEEVVEEPGGQHLAPALHLVSQGHQVALASTTGDDALGDQVRKWVTRYVERKASGGTGDLFMRPWRIMGSTRLTTAVTFGETRVIFDYDREGLPVLEAPRIELALWNGLKALYLGPYYLEFQEGVLDTLPSVPLKFFETGTRGPEDPASFQRSVEIARRCTHVLSSSAFVNRLVGGNEKLSNQGTQRLLYRDADKNGSYLAKKAFRLLWPTPADRGYLIVLIGRWGSLIVDQYEKVERIRAVKLPKKQGRNWLGCGDLFRAEFIHRVLIGASCEDAAKAATQAVAEKIPKMSFFLE